VFLQEVIMDTCRVHHCKVDNFYPLHNFMKMLQLFESYKIIGGGNVFRTAFSKRKRLHGQVNSPRGQTVLAVLDRE
jgi:hypothetical protein